MPPTCEDGEMNGGEEGVDCGGDLCDACPVDCEWNEWGACEAECGEGTQSRTKSVTESDGGTCEGADTQACESGHQAEALQEFFL
jgi:hypothetical protein